MLSKFISGENINLRDIKVEDAAFVLSLRTDERKSKFLHKTDADIKKQEAYIKRYYTLPEEFYFIIEDKSHRPLGTVRIYDVIDHTDFCWGSWLIVDDAEKSTAIESALLIYEYAFSKLGYTKTHFDVRKGNVRVQKFHEFCGAKRVGETDLDILYAYTKEDYEKILPKLKKIIG